MGMIKKQYQTAVTADEVNKLLQEKLSTYPRGKVRFSAILTGHAEDIDLTAAEIAFEFELGIAPEFTVKPKERKNHPLPNRSR